MSERRRLRSVIGQAALPVALLIGCTDNRLPGQAVTASPDLKALIPDVGSIEAAFGGAASGMPGAPNTSAELAHDAADRPGAVGFRAWRIEASPVVTARRPGSVAVSLYQLESPTAAAEYWTAWPSHIAHPSASNVDYAVVVGGGVTVDDLAEWTLPAPTEPSTARWQVRCLWVTSMKVPSSSVGPSMHGS